MKKRYIFLLTVVILILGWFAFDTYTTSKLTRSYPNFVKCSWKSYWDAGSIKLENFDEQGMNTICLMIGIPGYSGGRPSFLSSLKEYITKRVIKKAKRSGYSVFLTIDTSNSISYDDLSKDEYLDTVEGEALRWAKIAEKYKVEYFAPLNEIDGKLDIPEGWFSNITEERTRERVNATNAWHKSILPKIKKAYSGKTIAKYGDPLEGLKSEGYDLTSFTLDHYRITNLEEFRKKTREDIELMIAISKESKNDWIAGEIYYPTKEDFSSPDMQAKYAAVQESLEENQADYFRISIEEIEKLKSLDKPKGYAPFGYDSKSDYINAASMQVINEFFNKY